MFYSLRTRAVFNGQALTLHKKYSMNIVIIGATSGIGKALFVKYANADNRIGIVGRRTNLLNELSQQYPSKTIVSKADVTNLNETEQAINTLLKEFGHLDLAIMCAGVGDINATLDYAIERPAIDTNVVGWTYVITPVRDKIAISCMLIQIREFSSHAITHELYIKNRKRLFCL